MREGLGEVAPELPRSGVGLFGEQAEVVGESGGLLEKLDGVFYLPAPREVLDEPVGADEKPLLVSGPAVDEAVGGELYREPPLHPYGVGRRLPLRPSPVGAAPPPPPDLTDHKDSFSFTNVHRFVHQRLPDLGH